MAELSGNFNNSVQADEHIVEGLFKGKKSAIYGYDLSTMQWRRMAVDASGAIVIQPKNAATATESSVAASASSVALLAANSNRVGACIVNDSSSVLYVSLDSSASTSLYTVKMYQDEYYEVPYGYTGAISGIWISATGSAKVTELT